MGTIKLYNATKRLLRRIGREIDICKVDGYETNAVGYWELRYMSLDECDEPVFESNNIHMCDENGEIEDEYRVFHFAELSSNDQEEIPKALRAYIKQFGL